MVVVALARAVDETETLVLASGSAPAPNVLVLDITKAKQCGSHTELQGRITLQNQQREELLDPTGKKLLDVKVRIRDVGSADELRAVADRVVATLERILAEQ